MRGKRSDLLWRIAASLRLVAVVAARDLRGGQRGLAVFVLSLALGVACILAVGLADRSVVETIRRDARVLLGGDLVLGTLGEPLADATLAALAPEGARLVRSLHTHSFATSPAGRSLAVSLRAVGPGWPLYGGLELEPPMPLEQALAAGGAVAERALLARLGIGIGDRLQIGRTRIEVRAVLVREPDREAGFLAIGPRLLVSLDTLQKAEILLPGSLASYCYHFALSEGQDPEAVAADIRSRFPDARFQLRTPSDLEPRLRHFTERLASWLALAALSVLVVGALGIALAIRGYLAAKTMVIATLRCLGATGPEIVAIFALETTAFAGLGTALGLVFGTLVPALLFAFAGDLLPWRIRLILALEPYLVAAGLGFAAVLVASLPPLVGIRTVPAARLLRAVVEPVPTFRRGLVVALALAALFAAGLVLRAVPRREIGLAFVALLPLLLAALWGLAAALRALGRELARRLDSPRWRLAFGLLAQPSSPASGVVTVLGAGLAVLVTLALVGARLQAEVTEHLPQRAAALFLIDIQPAQRAALHRLVADTPKAAVLQEAPVVRARVVRIRGRPVEEVPIAEDVRWTIQRERALTWRREPPPVRLVAGEWWPPDYDGPPLVSIERRVAEGYGVAVGDTISFHILGRIIEARIANIRPEIDWRQGRIDFVFVLSPGVLEGAPVTWIAAIDLPEVAEAAFLDGLARELPNVTPIPMREVVAQIRAVLGKIHTALEVVGLLAVAGGLCALLGAIAADRRRLRYETVILKVLGATRRDLAGLLLVRYGVLACAAAAVALLFGSLGAWLVLRLLADLEPAFDGRAAATVLLPGIALVLLTAWLATRRLTRVPAARILAISTLP